MLTNCNYIKKSVLRYFFTLFFFKKKFENCYFKNWIIRLMFTVTPYLK